MAARLNAEQIERVRNSIRATQITKRLNSFVLGEKDECAHDGRKVEMSRAQVQAAVALLKKVCPDLTENNTTLDMSDNLASVIEAARRRVGD